MAEKATYTTDEVVSTIMGDDDNDYLIEHFELGSDDGLGFNSNV